MRRLAAIASLLISAVLATSAPAADSTIAVIIHRDRRAALTVHDLSNVYLKKRRFWEDGTPVVPINREAGSIPRETFSRRVLGGGSPTFADYWNDQYFHGSFPPMTLSSSDAVKRYVAADVNAIGYVWLSEADDSVRVILQLDEPVSSLPAPEH